MCRLGWVLMVQHIHWLLLAVPFRKNKRKSYKKYDVEKADVDKLKESNKHIEKYKQNIIIQPENNNTTTKECGLLKIG